MPHKPGAVKLALPATRSECGSHTGKIPLKPPFQRGKPVLSPSKGANAQEGLWSSMVLLEERKAN